MARSDSRDRGGGDRGGGGRGGGTRPPPRGGGGGSRSPSRGKKRRREAGTVNTWNSEKQFGFVSCTTSNMPDLFLHAEYFNQLDQRNRAKTRGLRRGDKVEFDVEEPQAGKRSAQAVNAELVESVRRSPSASRSPQRGRGAAPRPQIVFRAGDWDCPSCDFHNFARNTSCMKCDCPKSAGRSPGRGGR